MTASEVARYMNTMKSKVKSKRLVFLRGYYLSMYRTYMIRLFDECYVSDPTVFNQKELFRNIAELGIADMFGNSGSLNLDYRQTRFAYLKATDPTKKSFLYNLMNAIKYRDMCFYLDKVYEDYGFRDSQTGTIKLNMCLQGAKILSKSGAEFNTVVADCITLFEEEVKTLSFNEYIWCLAMHELGIPKEEWTKDGLLDGKLSHKWEVDCAEGILNGVFKVSGGKYTSNLLSWLKSHPWGDNRMSLESKGLYDYLFMTRFSEINSVIGTLTDVIAQDPDSALLGVYGSTVYYKQPRTMFEVPIGIFQIVNEPDDVETVLPEGCCIHGLTGEFYSVERLEEDEIGYAGCPIPLDTSKGRSFVYDREQTDVVFESWYSFNKNNIRFNDDYGKYPDSPFALGSVSDDLYRGYVSSLKGNNGLLIVLKVSKLEQFEQSKKEVFKFIEGVRK